MRVACTSTCQSPIQIVTSFTGKNEVSLVRWPVSTIEYLFKSTHPLTYFGLKSTCCVDSAVRAAYHRIRIVDGCRLLEARGIK